MMNKTTSKVGLAVILGSLVAFGPLSLDMYLPALPTLSAELHTTTSLTQLSLTSCLIGLAIGQLLAGSYSDVLGRRKPLLVGLAIYTVSSLACTISSSISVLIFLRFLQGLGGAAGIVIARSIVRDLYEGTEMTRFSAMLMLVNGAAPILAPIAGALLLQHFSWEGVFIILGLIGLIMMVTVVLYLPETLPKEKRSEVGLHNTLTTFRGILKDRNFMGFALAQGLVMAAMFAYISGSPFVIQQVYGASPEMFSIFFGINGAGIIIASQVTGRLAGHLDESVMFRTGLGIAAIASTLILLAILTSSSLTAVLIPLFFTVASVGIVTTSGFSLAMQKYGRSAGAASAILGLLPFIFGGTLAPLVGIAGSHTALPMGLVIFGTELGAVLCYILLAKRSNSIGSLSQADKQ
jgi:DHA1 family bicyclomycin/chloramphenicol resistance-like MFS transporter